MDTQPRDAHGRLQKGHDINKRKAGELRTSHAVHSGRDSKGRFAEGNLLGLSTRVLELRAALLNTVSETKIKAIINELCKLCLPGEHKVTEQLQAMALLLPYVVGRPSQELHTLVQSEHVERKEVAVNFSNLSVEELRQMENLLAKSESHEIVVQ